MSTAHTDWTNIYKDCPLHWIGRFHCTRAHVCHHPITLQKLKASLEPHFKKKKETLSMKIWWGNAQEGDWSGFECRAMVDVRSSEYNFKLPNYWKIPTRNLYFVGCSKDDLRKRETILNRAEGFEVTQTSVAGLTRTRRLEWWFWFQWVSVGC